MRAGLGLIAPDSRPVAKLPIPYWNNNMVSCMRPGLLNALSVLLLLVCLALSGCKKSLELDPRALSGAGTAPENTAASANASAPADYQTAVYDPLHFEPAIESATDAQCLACHQEVLQPTVRQQSTAGLAAAEARAWYQQLSTYSGAQDTFHRRHLETPLAKTLMHLRCITCHEGNEPRDEAPATSASTQDSKAILRKMVNPQTICLRCHGKMNWSVMGLPASWEQSGAGFQNNCLVCHVAVRTTRHQVNYLNAQAIEQAGASSGDACFGCHGGRAWYRLNYPYPRHAWSTMPAEIPPWAQGRPTVSEARFLTGLSAPKGKTP
jgi:hypothetical protein